MHERSLETRKPTCVPRADKSFFIPVVHSPSRTMGHVAAPELPSQEGRARSRGTHGSTGARLSKEARSRGHGTRVSAGAHLSKEVRSEVTGHVAAPKLTSLGRQGPELRVT
jgi:hypothetical protein